MLPVQIIILALSAVATTAQDEELSCDIDYTQNEKWCYELMEPVNRLEIAHYNCLEKTGELISIHSEKENAFIASFGVDVLIGLRYSPTNFSWIDKTPLDVQFWETDHPMKPEYFGECVILQKSGKWINSQCNQKAHYVCKKAASFHQCPVQPKNQLFDKGEMISPGYPGNYISGLSCTYTLMVKNHNFVTISIFADKMGIGDMLEIFGGTVASNDSQIALVERTGSTAASTFSTPNGQNKMLVKFTSRSQTGGNWKFNFTTSPNCAHGWSDIGEGGLERCYKYGWEEMYVADAKWKCYQLGGQLPSIKNAFENKLLSKILEYEGGTAWLGLEYESEAWKWTDGSSSLYTNWDNGEPNINVGRCATTTYSGKWKAEDCDRGHRALCYQL